jgi:hypothetical protein
MWSRTLADEFDAKGSRKAAGELNSRPICFTSIGLPLMVKAVLRAITKLTEIRERPVVRRG